ncbi:MAG: hypothetical protein Q8873_03675 [Bacillota bacterium]|nr:hypothetical protein [Bacillota bacterium]
MLKKIFNYKVCVWLIVILLVVSICFVPFTTSYFMGTKIPTGTLMVLYPILLGVIYAILVSCEPEKMTEKKQTGFGIAYACIFVVFYALDIWAIVYAIMKIMKIKM